MKLSGYCKPGYRAANKIKFYSRQLNKGATGGVTKETATKPTGKNQLISRHSANEKSKLFLSTFSSSYSHRVKILIYSTVFQVFI